MRERCEFLGIGFDMVDLAGARRWVAGRSAGSHFAYVVTPNVDHMVRLAREDSAVRRAYADADLCLCDSRVLSRLARLCGVKLPVAPGSDLIPALFLHVLKPGDRICLIGSGAADAARLRALYPDLVIDHHLAPMGLRGDAAARSAAADAAIASAARLTLLAVGSPQQELLANELASRAEASGTALCIGASVDFLTGVQKRAPTSWRRLGLEWAWRLATNPRRLARRYLIEGPAIFLIVWRWRRARRALR